MRIVFTAFVYLALSLSLCFAQEVKPDPPFSPGVGNPSDPIGPGLVKATITPLRAIQDTTLCRREVPNALILVVNEVLVLGSGLITTPNDGDTLVVQMIGQMEVAKTSTALLKEELCFDATSSLYRLLRIE